MAAAAALDLYVYPGYLAWRIKRALQVDDGENLLASVGGIETVGDCRYAIPVTDHRGTVYRITVEVVPLNQQHVLETR